MRIVVDMALSDGARTGELRFQVFGIPVGISPAFWLITGLLGMGRLDAPVFLVEWVGVVLVSVLVHELGHALVARGFGQSVYIELHGLGGSTWHDGHAELSAGRRIAISLAGPLAGVAFGAVIFAAGRVFPPASALVASALQDALWVNWGYGLLNLLPILPLDGGHVMQELVDGVTRRRNHPAANVISLVVAVGLLAVSLALGFRSGLFLLGWLILRNLQDGNWLGGRDRAG